VLLHNAAPQGRQTAAHLAAHIRRTFSATTTLSLNHGNTILRCTFCSGVVDRKHHEVGRIMSSRLTKLSKHAESTHNTQYHHRVPCIQVRSEARTSYVKRIRNHLYESPHICSSHEPSALNPAGLSQVEMGICHVALSMRRMPALRSQPSTHLHGAGKACRSNTAQKLRHDFQSDRRVNYLCFFPLLQSPPLGQAAGYLCAEHATAESLYSRCASCSKRACRH
jgi:hypothetical protein